MSSRPSLDTHWTPRTVWKMRDIVLFDILFRGLLRILGDSDGSLIVLTAANFVIVIPLAIIFSKMNAVSPLLAPDPLHHHGSGTWVLRDCLLQVSPLAKIPRLIRRDPDVKHVVARLLSRIIDFVSSPYCTNTSLDHQDHHVASLTYLLHARERPRHCCRLHPHLLLRAFESNHWQHYFAKIGDLLARGGCVLHAAG